MLLSTSVYAASDDLTYVKVNADVNTSRATTNELNTVAIGPSANADASGSIAIGLKSSTIKSSGATNANDAIAIGTSSSASNTGSVAIGKSTSSSNGGVAIANGSNSSGTNAVAIGVKSKSSAENTVALGSDTVASNVRAVAVGALSQATGHSSIAMGNAVQASKDFAMAIGRLSNASGVSSVAIGNTAVASNTNTTAMGMKAEASGEKASAVGESATASGSSSSAFGTGAKATASGTTALGNGNKAVAVNATAVGVENTSSGEAAVAVGTQNNVSGNTSGAIGVKNVVTNANSYVLGNNVTTTQDNSIVLGNESIDRAATTESKATIGNLTYGTFVGQGSKANGVVSVGAEGKERQLINVAAGKVSANSTDAINGSQLYAVANTLNNVAASTVSVLGGNAEVAPDGTITMSNIGSTGKSTVDEAIKAARSEVTPGENTIVQETTGSDGQKIYTVNAYKSEIEQAAGSAIKSTASQAGYTTTYTLDLTDETKANIQKGIDANTMVTTKGLTFVGDHGNTDEQLLGRAVNVKGDGNNITTEASGNTVTVKMSDTPTFTSVDSDSYNVGGTTYINSNGINANNKKVTNVAPGEISAISTDAVNGSQLYETKQSITNMGNTLNRSVSHLDNKINKVGAGAAALAGLHPLDFNPDDKWNFAVGYGNYKNANAMAIGAFYRPNEDTMFSVGSSMGNGENMVNAGISFKLGQSNGVSNSRVAMAHEIVELKETVNKLLVKNNEMQNRISSLENQKTVATNSNFSDISPDHWAYQYVMKLAEQGVLEGYPDGTFRGNQPMTRYELAAMLCRAIENGVFIDANMGKALKEFEPEVQVISANRIRVDRVSGKDNDRHKVERVRINNENNKAEKLYKDVYGSTIEAPAK